MKNIELNQKVKFPKGKQKDFLEQAALRLNVKKPELARIAEICSRTLFDWEKEKYNMSLLSLKKICEKLGKKQPESMRVLPAYWSLEKARVLGGKKYAALYGSPGTLEGRIKGGIASQVRFMSDPGYAKRIGLKSRKTIRYPAKSSLLAEFIGIMLGDGGVRSDYQITISFNGKKDRAYAAYIRKTAKKLFGISSTLYIRKEKGRADIVITGRNLVEFLQKMGIKKGNKVKNQVSIPKWIFERNEYQRACLRGLFDTDGCIYQHAYTVGGKRYRYVKMCFRNYSAPILVSLARILRHLGFCPKVDKKHKSLYLHKPIEVSEYFSKIGTSNPRYRDKHSKFFSTKIGRLGRVA